MILTFKKRKINQSLPSSLKNKRPKISGKFITIQNEKFYIKGITYGTFKPDENGYNFPDKTIIEKDFALMAANGINAVRTYTVPPAYLLDLAEAHDLKVMIGLPWEQHITFLDTAERVNAIIRKVEEDVMTCRNHPAILCYTIGNEIPAPIVRWYGAKKIEQFLKRLYKSVKKIDPLGLVTYVNYPTTEYLDLSFLDFQCFNVYLETKEKLVKYLARLHNLSGDKPLVLAEIGMDSQRNGLSKQAETLDWQIQTIFGTGSAGLFVFAWTDAWWRGGYDIEDWDFGIVDREGIAKPALGTVSKAYNHVITGVESAEYPLISVVVCSYNGSATIGDTMEGLLRLDYPNYEVIVVNDGSTDNLTDIVQEYPFKLISTKNEGLSSARNTGLYQSKGEIIAYIDDDAYPDPQWLNYLVYAYQNSNHVGIGGPNIAPKEDGLIADCVANAPGGPVHVLLTDENAEHIPGCNMSFKRDALLAIGGFDPIFRAAGDDVDVCWRIQANGGTIGYHPGALVWHHRRNSVKAYWNQQKGYGKAEALLERKWPEKYNNFGHLSWSGRIYGNGLTQCLKLKKDKVFYGTWGTALFQSVYQQNPHFLSCISLMPEWYLLIGFLSGLSLLGLIWAPLLKAFPLLLLALGILIMQAGYSATKANFIHKPDTLLSKIKYWGLTAILHIIQPIARLYGRIKHGLTPWRKRGYEWDIIKSLSFSSNIQKHWSEIWKSSEEWLVIIERNLIAGGFRVKRSGLFDAWDLQVSCGFFSSARGILTIEEHGSGKQYVKFKSWINYSITGLVFIGILAVISFLALFDGSYSVAALLSVFTSITAIKYFFDTMRAIAGIKNAFSELSIIQLDGKDLADMPVIFQKVENGNAVYHPAFKWKKVILPDEFLPNLTKKEV